MQVTLGVAGESERMKQRRFRAANCLGDQRAHANHFVAMIGVRDDKAILSQGVEYGEAIRGKGANAARGLFFELGQGACESFLTVGKSGYPHLGEPWTDNKFR